MLASGDKSYTIGWFCDNCYVQYLNERMSEPFFRCYFCELDYCKTCSDRLFNPLSPTDTSRLPDQLNLLRKKQYLEVAPIEIDEEKAGCHLQIVA
jgi:hypothetical protein